LHLIIIIYTYNLINISSYFIVNKNYKDHGAGAGAGAGTKNLIITTTSPINNNNKNTAKQHLAGLNYHKIYITF
jgi:hypothetical protein